MKRGSTLLLRAAAGTIGIGVLALCVLLLPTIWIHAYTEFPDYGYALRVVVAAMYVSAVPFYYGLYQGWRTLDAIDRGEAFSEHSVRSLRHIARCAGIISGVYVVTLPFVYIWAEHDDAPGLILIGLFLIGMPLIISVAVGLLQRLLADAVRIKSENDLTV